MLIHEIIHVLWTTPKIPEGRPLRGFCLAAEQTRFHEPGLKDSLTISMKSTHDQNQLCKLCDASQQREVPLVPIH